MRLKKRAFLSHRVDDDEVDDDNDEEIKSQEARHSKTALNAF